MVEQPRDPDQVLLDVVDDYRHSRGFFERKNAEEDVNLPLKEALSELESTGEIETDRQKSQYVTYTLALNFSKPAERLSRRIQKLWKTEPWLFAPESLVGDQRYDELLNLFNGRGEYESHPATDEFGLMEHGKTDAAIWYTVAYTLYDEFDSSALSLIENYDEDAKRIYEYVSEARREEPVHEDIRFTKKFPYLGGEKIGPLWLRAIDDYVRPLDNIALLPIPVDVQVARVTNYLFGTDYSAEAEEDREAIRERYRRFSNEYDQTSTRLDKALWLIGEGWNVGGEDYLEHKIEQL